jgi:signal peptidase II
MKSRDLNARDLGLLAAGASLLADQSTKLLMLYAFGFAAMAPGEHVQVLPFFNLVMVWNPGVSYGLFPAHGTTGTAVLATFQLLAVVGLSWWMWNTRRDALGVGLGLVIGGAVGNLLDRLIHGAVADFFHFYAFGYDWYVFNVADLAITFGVIALLYDALLGSETQAAGGKSQAE